MTAPVFIELIDLLRCPRQHADTWLVAAFTTITDRFVVTGRLGCPICSANYTIMDRVADLRVNASPEVENMESRRGSDSEESVVRAAALLGLTKPNSVVVLAGATATMSQGVSDLGEARVIAVNPGLHISESERVAVILADSRFPLGPSSIDGIILDDTTASFASDAARVLRSGGRLVAPIGTNLPGGFRELARDDKQIVAESIGDLVRLSR